MPDGVDVDTSANPPLRVSITRLLTVEGTSIPVPRGGITVFVGPNNAGKSAALRDIQQHLTRAPHSQPPTWIVIGQIEADKESTDDELIGWLTHHASRYVQSGVVFYRRLNAQVQETVAGPNWNQGPPFADLGQLLTFYLSAGGGQGYVGPAASFNVREEAPSHPLQALYLQSALELRVREVSRRAFRSDVVVNRFGGNQIFLHVGSPPPFEGEPGLPTKAYLDQLFGLPALHQQGDGMKSFMGVMVSLIAAAYPFILIDEPEAFLHPPQARLLGRFLCEYRPSESQVFTATHDSNVLRGLVDSGDNDVTVVRLTRAGETGSAAQLDPDSVRKLWSDPLLRYSNILEGLFHRAVVLCEADADCRYYSSILDTLSVDESSEILFTHCGGKHRMPMVVRALRAVRVPTHVIADFDLLRDEQPLRALVEEMDGTWEAIQTPWRRLKSALDSEQRRPSRHYIREHVVALLDQSTDALLDEREIDMFRHLAKGEGGWEKAKRGGVGAVPQGNAAVECADLLAKLGELRIHVVPVGELERWVSSVGGHGPDWVAAVHELGLHAAPESDPARAFLGGIVSRALAE